MSKRKPGQLTASQIQRTRKELEDCAEDAAQMVAHGNSNYPGMSYEEGVDATLRWVLGKTEDHPMKDE